MSLVALLASAWIEIIQDPFEFKGDIPSHSSRVRGLKLGLPMIARLIVPVALLASAWIEISQPILQRARR